jgi:hypothetical protein
VWRHAWSDGAHCPSAARHAAFNDHMITFQYYNLENLLCGKLTPSTTSQIPQTLFQLSSEIC